ncbi:hypothetical protein [uncultured Chryseobacterium sp.]|uniref:hypothetical protein n=1 Tax=uncultured Chryseobacterium sp. TaxID=259322 RepID=UPI003748C687
MKKYHRIFISILYSFMIVGCHFKETELKDFDEYQFDVLIPGEGVFNIGHSFIINDESYINKQYNFMYYPRNFEERRLLIPGSVQNSGFPVYWREVELPFRIIKKAEGDTLLVIKNNSEFIFKKVRNSDE